MDSVIVLEDSDMVSKESCLVSENSAVSEKILEESGLVLENSSVSEKMLEEAGLVPENLSTTNSVSSDPPMDDKQLHDMLEDPKVESELPQQTPASNNDEVEFDDASIHFENQSSDEPSPQQPAPTSPVSEVSNMIDEFQTKVDNALNPHIAQPSSSSSNKKRKLTTPSISLLSFINILRDILNDMTFDKLSKEMRFKRNIRAYIDENIEPTIKRMKLDASTTFGANISTYSPDFQQRVVNCILNKIFSHLESQNMQFLFPKEMLKFFLATYKKFITPNDFINTNAIIKSERRSKNSGPLNNGAILNEYVKGFDTFSASMPRSDHDDIKALKFIVENKLSIPYTMYNIINNISFDPPSYVTDSKIEYRQDYAQILIANSKHLYVLITSDILLYYDGNQFVIPPSNIEREFTIHMKQSPMLKTGDYVLLEVLSATKVKIVDILQYRIGSDTKLPSKYTERLAFVQKILPHATTVSITPQQVGGNANGLDYSYIQKPNDGFDPAYIYHKSNLIAAAVGVIDKTVVLAFLENDSTLVIKSKVSICGPVTGCISVMAYKSKDGAELECPKIMMGNVEYKIIGDVNGVQLFEQVIAVELKDGNRLGCLSTNSISKAFEYKPVTVKKETATLMKDIERRLENEDFVMDLLKSLTSAPIMMNEDTKNMLKKWLSPEISVSFDGYKMLDS
nr:TPA: gp37-like protein [Oryctes rhinoceros nudivirus]